MRTTLTLDPDIVVLLREQAARSRRPFKQVVNEALRLGLRASGSEEPRQRFVVKPHHFGQLRPGLDPDKMNQLAGELEDEAIVEKLRRDQRGE